MIGTIINAATILAGGLVGTSPRCQLSALRQQYLKVGLGVFTVFVGLKLVWNGLNGPFLQILKQLGIVLLAMTLGRLIGKLLHLQKLSNHVGDYAKARMARASPTSPSRFNDGFVTCTLLFCAAPLAVLGGLQDGLQNNWHLLAIKAVMDGLAVMAFATMFGRGVMLSALPVVAWQGLLTLAAQALVKSGVLPAPSALLDAVNATCGLLAFSVALVILELKKIELTDYLPSLAVAPLLTWLLR